MKRYVVTYAPKAENQLFELFSYIADACGNDFNAGHYVAGITHFCDGLEYFPIRGTDRSDIRPGVRVTHVDGRTIIAFSVDEAASRVQILGIFYGGQDYGRSL